MALISFHLKKTASKNVLCSCPTWFTPSPCDRCAPGQSWKAAHWRCPRSSRTPESLVPACPRRPAPRGWGCSGSMASLLAQLWV